LLVFRNETVPVGAAIPAVESPPDTVAVRVQPLEFAIGERLVTVGNGPVTVSAAVVEVLDA
jgi:hypothetical protein